MTNYLFAAVKLAKKRQCDALFAQERMEKPMNLRYFGEANILNDNYHESFFMCSSHYVV